MKEIQETQVQSLAGNFPWWKIWQPIPVFLPGKSHGQRNLVGYSSWGCKELDMTEHARTRSWAILRGGREVYRKLLLSRLMVSLKSQWVSRTRSQRAKLDLR